MPSAEAAVLEILPETGPNAGACSQAPRSRVNFLWTLSSNILYAGCQWMMLVVMAKICAPAEVGIFALGLAVTAPVLMLTNLQLRTVQSTDARNSFRFNEYFQLRLLTTGLAFVAILLVALTQPRSAAAVVAILGLSKCFEAMSDVLQGYLQRGEHMAVIARSIMLKGAVSLAFLGAAVLLAPTALAAAWGVCAGSALTFLMYDRPAAARVRAVAGDEQATPFAAKRRMLELAWLALPLGIVQGLVSLSANIPRYYLEHFAGMRDLGIYSALASLIVAGQTVVSALGNVASPRLARLFAEGKFREYRTLLLTLMSAGLGIGVAGIGIAAAFGCSILSLLFRPEYAAHNDVLILLMVGGTFAYLAWFAGFGMSAAREFRSQIPLLAAVCLAAWAASAWLVPSQGAYGAAMALTISMSVQLTGAVIVLFRIGRRTQGAVHAF